VFTPSPSIAGHLNPETPSYTSPLYTTSKITFNNVNFTIPDPEAIIVNYLTFSIFNINDQENAIAHVNFSINGTEISPDYPFDKFTVMNKTDTSYLSYVSGGSFSGYDEEDGQYYDYGYGYGYGSGNTPLTIPYTITYTTHTTGTFIANSS
jgi:hypothetical protein